MKLSLKWLSDYVDTENLSVDEIASKLTMGAFEVEEVQKVGTSLKEPIIIGKILDIQKHPNADRLQITTVTTNGSNKLQIVCGATNIQIGQLVPVSLPQAEVINRKDGSKLIIRKSTIREIESEGMLASPAELGIETNEPDGILIFSENAPLGKSVIEYLSLKPDFVFEVGSRSNRGDALSVLGLGKEICALTGKKLKNLDFKEPKFDGSITTVKCSIENPEDTFIFFTATIENIVIKESPTWLKELLRSIGTKPINNIVDITNYVNFTFGQPMHAYDKAKLNGDLIARKAKKGEKIRTLDDKVRDFKEGILVIADQKNPVAIAGIMGGKESEVTDNTKSIVFEAAVFNPVKVRKGSREIGLTTESSKRFERLVDSNFTYKALLKAIEITCKLANPESGEIKIGKIYQSGTPIKKNISITLSTTEVKKVLNIDLDTNNIKNLLSKLEFDCKILNTRDLEVKVPENRANDVTRSIDLIEEIARLYSYDKIPALPPPTTSTTYKTSSGVLFVKSHMLSAGFSESYLTSLIGEQALNYKSIPFNPDKAVKMLNPLSREHSVLRQSLLPGLLDAVKLNTNHQLTNIRLFEIGKIYLASSTKEPTQKETCVEEINTLAAVMTPPDKFWLQDQNIEQKNNDHLFFDTKGILESLFSRLLESETEKIKISPSNKKFLHPKYSIDINLEREYLGYLGLLHPETTNDFNFNMPILTLEIYLDSLLTIHDKLLHKKLFKKISAQPALERDITIDIQKKYLASEVESQINSVISDFIINIKLISIYELNNELRSLTYRLKMQDPKRTLTSKEVDNEVNKVINHLTSCFQAKFRV